MSSSVSTDVVPRERFRAWWPAVALMGAGTLAFLAVAADVVAHGWLAQCDLPIQFYFHEHSSYALVLLAAAISGLGQLSFIGPFALIIGAALLAKRRWRCAAGWATALIGSGIINPSLKALFHVPRPERFTFYTFELHSGYSFPSGHTMAVAIAAGALALVLLHNAPASRARKRLAFAAVAALSLLEAFSLMYIGVHYLTDVLGALAVSAAWLGVIWWILPPAVREIENGE